MHSWPSRTCSGCRVRRRPPIDIFVGVRALVGELRAPGGAGDEGMAVLNRAALSAARTRGAGASRRTERRPECNLGLAPVRILYYQYTTCTVLGFGLWFFIYAASLSSAAYFACLIDSESDTQTQKQSFTYGLTWT
jgi:hypothetical protein